MQGTHNFVYVPANERQRYIETSSVIGKALTQNDPCNSVFLPNQVYVSASVRAG